MYSYISAVFGTKCLVGEQSTKNATTLLSVVAFFVDYYNTNLIVSIAHTITAEKVHQKHHARMTRHCK